MSRPCKRGRLDDVIDDRIRDLIPSSKMFPEPKKIRFLEPNVLLKPLHVKPFVAVKLKRVADACDKIIAAAKVQQNKYVVGKDSDFKFLSNSCLPRLSESQENICIQKQDSEELQIESYCLTTNSETQENVCIQDKTAETNRVEFVNSKDSRITHQTFVSGAQQGVFKPVGVNENSNASFDSNSDLSCGSETTRQDLSSQEQHNEPSGDNKETNFTLVPNTDLGSFSEPQLNNSIQDMNEDSEKNEEDSEKVGQSLNGAVSEKDVVDTVSKTLSRDSLTLSLTDSLANDPSQVACQSEICNNKEDKRNEKEAECSEIPSCVNSMDTAVPGESTLQTDSHANDSLQQVEYPDEFRGNIEDECSEIPSCIRSLDTTVPCEDKLLTDSHENDSSQQVEDPSEIRSNIENECGEIPSCIDSLDATVPDEDTLLTDSHTDFHENDSSQQVEDPGEIRGNIEDEFYEAPSCISSLDTTVSGEDTLQTDSHADSHTNDPSQQVADPSEIRDDKEDVQDENRTERNETSSCIDFLDTTSPGEGTLQIDSFKSETDVNDIDENSSDMLDNINNNSPLEETISMKYICASLNIDAPVWVDEVDLELAKMCSKGKSSRSYFNQIKTERDRLEGSDDDLDTSLDDNDSSPIPDMFSEYTESETCQDDQGNIYRNEEISHTGVSPRQVENGSSTNANINLNVLQDTKTDIVDHSQRLGDNDFREEEVGDLYSKGTVVDVSDLGCENSEDVNMRKSRNKQFVSEISEGTDRDISEPIKKKKKVSCGSLKDDDSAERDSKEIDGFRKSVSENSLGCAEPSSYISKDNKEKDGIDSLQSYETSTIFNHDMNTLSERHVLTITERERKSQMSSVQVNKERSAPSVESLTNTAKKITRNESPVSQSDIQNISGIKRSFSSISPPMEGGHDSHTKRPCVTDRLMTSGLKNNDLPVTVKTPENIASGSFSVKSDKGYVDSPKASACNSDVVFLSDDDNDPTTKTTLKPKEETDSESQRNKTKIAAMSDSADVIEVVDSPISVENSVSVSQTKTIESLPGNSDSSQDVTKNATNKENDESHGAVIEVIDSSSTSPASFSDDLQQDCIAETNSASEGRRCSCDCDKMVKEAVQQTVVEMEQAIFGGSILAKLTAKLEALEKENNLLKCVAVKLKGRLDHAINSHKKEKEAEVKPVLVSRGVQVNMNKIKADPLRHQLLLYGNKSHGVSNQVHSAPSSAVSNLRQSYNTRPNPVTVRVQPQQQIPHPPLRHSTSSSSSLHTAISQSSPIQSNIRTIRPGHVSHMQQTHQPEKNLTYAAAPEPPTHKRLSPSHTSPMEKTNIPVLFAESGVSFVRQQNSAKQTSPLPTSSQGRVNQGMKQTSPETQYSKSPNDNSELTFLQCLVRDPRSKTNSGQLPFTSATSAYSTTANHMTTSSISRQCVDTSGWPRGPSPSLTNFIRTPQTNIPTSHLNNQNVGIRMPSHVTSSTTRIRAPNVNVVNMPHCQLNRSVSGNSVTTQSRTPVNPQQHLNLQGFPSVRQQPPQQLDVGRSTNHFVTVQQTSQTVIPPNIASKLQYIPHNLNLRTSENDRVITWLPQNELGKTSPSQSMQISITSNKHREETVGQRTNQVFQSYPVSSGTQNIINAQIRVAAPGQISVPRSNMPNDYASRERVSAVYNASTSVPVTHVSRQWSKTDTIQAANKQYSLTPAAVDVVAEQSSMKTPDAALSQDPQVRYHIRSARPEWADDIRYVATKYGSTRGKVASPSPTKHNTAAGKQDFEAGTPQFPVRREVHSQIGVTKPPLMQGTVQQQIPGSKHQVMSIAPGQSLANALQKHLNEARTKAMHGVNQATSHQVPSSHQQEEPVTSEMHSKLSQLLSNLPAELQRQPPGSRQQEMAEVLKQSANYIFKNAQPKMQSRPPALLQDHVRRTVDLQDTTNLHRQTTGNGALRSNLLSRSEENTRTTNQNTFQNVGYDGRQSSVSQDRPKAALTIISHSSKPPSNADAGKNVRIDVHVAGTTAQKEQSATKEIIQTSSRLQNIAPNTLKADLDTKQKTGNLKMDLILGKLHNKAFLAQLSRTNGSNVAEQIQQKTPISSSTLTDSPLSTVLSERNLKESSSLMPHTSAHGQSTSTRGQTASLDVVAPVVVSSNSDRTPPTENNTLSTIPNKDLDVPPQPSLVITCVNNCFSLKWDMESSLKKHAPVEYYQIFSFFPSPGKWIEIGVVKALPLPMACTLTELTTGGIYNFAVRAVDTYGRPGVISDMVSIIVPS